ncbi:MAG: phenylacetate--CoA ligase family protein [Anaerofustis sp.]|jgi:phenylacetate-CoA ligase
MKYQMWDEKAETVSRDELHANQTEKLIKMVQRIYEHVPFYKNAFDERGILPGDVKSVDDLANLPFTKKGDLRDHYPKKMFAAPDDEVVRIHASSGTTGKPTVVGYTKNDINLWADLMARSLTCAGATKHSVVQNALGYGLFTGGLGFHYGAERLGAQVIPMSGGNTEKQIMIMMDFKSDILIATPSYAMHLGEVLEEKGYGPDDIPLKFAPLGAEPWTEEMRNEIEKKLGIKAINSFGMSELIGPGVAMECLDQQGMHIWEDHFVPEIIDPDTGEVLPDGMTGELVVTAMTKECLPLLRYRTRDIARLEKSVCSCGRTMARIQRLTGRTDDMLIIRGVNVFPSQIEGILLDTEGASPNYQLVLSTHNNMTNLEVRVEVLPEYFTDDITRLSSVSEKIGNKIKTFIGINVKVTILEPKTLPRSEGKAVRIIDNRNK